MKQNSMYLRFRFGFIAVFASVVSFLTGCTPENVIYLSSEVNFGYERISPLTISIKDSSLEVSEYLWDFGDGSTSTEKNPSHTYASYGNYKVTLTAKNDGRSETSSSSGDYNTTVKYDGKTKTISKTIDVTDVVSLNNQNTSTDNYFDVDFDGVSDFRLFHTVFGGFITGQGSSSGIQPLNNLEIFSDSLDVTVYYAPDNTPTIRKYHIPKIYVPDNTISNSDPTKNTSLYFKSNMNMYYEYHYEFDTWTSSVERYIGFKKIVDNKTKIGWLKLKVSDQTTTLFSYKILSETNALVIKEQTTN